eukprot:CAMPEP_0172176300 /NCGR_PEP_ID=MMETSP1050-20130122/14721_1 /TAXON_ID=233186 /ORGANISM="Cryptomonas curvata, Strain CCAP979/52" /LENGTH=37 /DNA_ID= /DNA_START= /DNA_END= /DNA_ORIENTATION=
MLDTVDVGVHRKGTIEARAWGLVGSGGLDVLGVGVDG